MKANFLITLILSFFLANILFAQPEWLTGYDLNNLPRLSPRPNEVMDVKENQMSLNGKWLFTGGHAVQEEIVVPGEWEMQGYKVDSADAALYERTFRVPEDWIGKRIKLRFDAVHSYCRVKVNGQEVGEHEGGFVPFELDISDKIKSGINDLAVEVRCLTVADMISYISYYAGHPVGGILRKVTLFVLPEVNLSSLSYTTRFDKQYRDAVLKIPFEITNEGKAEKNATIEFALRNAEGQLLKLSRNRLIIKQIEAGSTRQDSISLKISAPEKWSAETPYLYELITRLFVDGKKTEEYVQKIGFREIELRGNQLFVNNHPIRLRGVNRHSINPLSGRSVSAEQCLNDALLFREGNCNYIRTSHYPPEEEFLQYCDSLGLYVENESAVCWIGHGAASIWKRWKFDDARFLPYFLNANIEKMIAYRNHPSVILWSLANESSWSPLWAQVNSMIKKLDPSRPTAFHDQAFYAYNNIGSTSDIANYHYPNLNDVVAVDTVTRPLLFGEYVHVETYNRREVLTDPFVRVDWGRPMRWMYDSLCAHQGVLGGAIWAGIDEVFYMPDGRATGYGPWGVIDGWRRKKPEFEEMKLAYSPVVIQNRMNPQFQNDHLTLQIENRYDFLNLSELKIHFNLNGETGMVRGNIPHRETGTLEIPVKKEQLLKHDLLICFEDPRGFVCQELKIPRLQNTEGKSELLTKDGQSIETTETNNGLHIKNGNTNWFINKSSGLLESAGWGDKKVLIAAPAVIVVQLNEDDGGGKSVNVHNNYQRDIFPLKNGVMGDWVLSETQTIKHSDGTSEIVTKGSYPIADGIYHWKFEKDGSVKMSYRFTIQKDTLIKPRQWGVVFKLPDSYQQLYWERKEDGRIYPDNSIARTVGTADANRNESRSPEGWGKPTVPWKDDPYFMGSRDFRSTKANIYRARLRSADEAAIMIESKGNQSVRTWLEGANTFLLIAKYNSGGSDHFTTKFYLKERMELKKGDVIEDEIVFKLLP
ncbi:MAG: beta-galactosidase [Chitinophagaceae bacterium]|nr:beta-galactosidase [Chitinophagaceae bacterium]